MEKKKEEKKNGHELSNWKNSMLLFEFVTFFKKETLILMFNCGCWMGISRQDC